MDDHQMPCERADMSERIVAIQASDKDSGDLLSVGHHAEMKDQLLTKKLLTVVSELIGTLADALSRNREATQECMPHARAILLSCAFDGDESVDVLMEPNERQAYRGGLAPWQVRSVTTYIDANLNASLSCEVM